MLNARRPAVRLWLAALFAIAQIMTLVPVADAQTASTRATATWGPKTVTPRELAGVCPTDQQPDAACPIARGVTYQTSVTFAVDQAVQPLILQVQGNGLEIQATSRATSADFTRQLGAGQAETIDLSVTVPETTGRNDRSFYLGKVSLLGGGVDVAGSLIISLTIQKARVSWGRIQLNDNSGDAAPLQTTVGAGATFTRKVTFTPSLDVDDFAVRANTDRIKVTGAPTQVKGGVTQNLLLTFNAPIVNRKTRMDVTLFAVTGNQPLTSSLRMRVIVLPAEIRWGPPQIRATLNAEEQKPIEKTLTITSNYDIPNVQFKTEDVGLTPILSPLGPVNLKAGVPLQVKVKLCPGYAPTTYFLGLTAYQGSKPLNQRLQIKMQVDGDATRIKPLPEGAKDPCAG